MSTKPAMKHGTLYAQLLYVVHGNLKHSVPSTDTQSQSVCGEPARDGTTPASRSRRSTRKSGRPATAFHPRRWAVANAVLPWTPGPGLESFPVLGSFAGPSRPAVMSPGRGDDELTRSRLCCAQSKQHAAYGHAFPVSIV